MSLSISFSGPKDVRTLQHTELNGEANYYFDKCDRQTNRHCGFLSSLVQLEIKEYLEIHCSIMYDGQL